jgi:catechol 2,3-dioxygenase-like lactoylglutathione lyase family enzyme
MIGPESLDHVAVPVIDLERAENFYMEVLGLKLKTRRKNLDGSPRQTYVLAGENIIGLHLPGVQTEASGSRAPRVGIAVGEERVSLIIRKLHRAGVPFHVSQPAGKSPFLRSLFLLDPDSNWVELCIWKAPLEAEYLSHIVVEAADLTKARAFYQHALGMEFIGQFGEEYFLRLRTGQFYVLRPVPELSERSRRHGRGCHIALMVAHEDFDEMLRRIPEHGGQNQGDQRSEDGLRPQGEKSTYLFDVDKNRLQITAPVAQSAEMLDDEEKWRRIVDNRGKQGKGVSRWDRGEGKLKTED